MRSAHLIGLILTLALVAGACSGDGESPQIASLETDAANTSEGAGTADADLIAESEGAMLAFTQCLRDQGIDVDDPTIDADENMQLPPISIEVPDVVSDPDQVPDMSEFEDMLLSYAECMRANGVDMPDPDFSSGGGVIDLGAIGGEDYEAADAACSPLLADLRIGG